eukprot:TRINITY_DN5205_c0_g1_i1.p1 TRINITY_DN5205_c0_g1~~TRINITY_DN5205_c0_g1_i1.p1  ORF type:complete len:561 (-),score=76.61 TRINITY_DN5205_c0_g1_i1:239-1795(-)
MLVDRLGRYRHEFRLHFLTSCYVAVTFVFSFEGSLEMVFRCTSSNTAKIFWNWVVCFAASLAKLGVQIWLSLVKVRLLEAVAPRSKVFAEVLARVCVVAATMAFLTDALWEQGSIGDDPYQPVFIVLGSCLLAYWVTVIFVLELSARSALLEASNADVGDELAVLLAKAARWTRWAWFMTAFAASSGTFVYVVYAFWEITDTDVQWYRLAIAAQSVDAMVNIISCMMLSGIIGANVDVEQHMRTTVMSAHAKRHREIKYQLANVVGSSEASAVTLACIMGGVAPEEILNLAAARFRSVSWDVLRQRPDLIIGGAPLHEIGPGESDMHLLAEPCMLGECDAFISHSWRDSGELKWHALQTWCDEFAQLHGRSPRLWLDKVCIDQRNIDMDLQCLPIFLAGCNTLLAMSGATYRHRLWCCVELLVHNVMTVADPSRNRPDLWLLSHDDEQLELQSQGWLSFDVKDCDCFDLADKRRFLHVLAQYPGGANSFNNFIRGLTSESGRHFVMSPAHPYDYIERV